MKKRYLPFGYRMQNGKVIFEPKEKQAVRFIFAEYLEGRSLRQIAATMSAKEIPYHSDEPKWNQNMVSRILANENYCGQGKYPPIISEKQYEQAKKQRQSKANTYSNVLQPFRQDMQCGSCGARLYWRPKTEQWFCRQCGMWTKPIPERFLAGAIKEKLEWLQQTSQAIVPPKKNGRLQSVEAVRLNREIQTAMAEPESETDSLIEKILRCAELQYDCCTTGEHDPVTLQIKKACTEYGQSEKFPLDFYNVAVNKVNLYRDTHIEIELQNRQII